MFIQKYRVLLLVCLIAIPILLMGCSIINDSVIVVNDTEIETLAPVEEGNSEEGNEEEPLKVIYKGDLELPVVGATGYTSIEMELKSSNQAASETIDILKPGTAFEILEEIEGWWQIKRGATIGWVEHLYCFINLPDVIPSIVYNNTNTYASKFKSSGVDIPDITGQQLYLGKLYNSRLERNEYIVPVLYSMSKKIYHAQQEALSEGNSLIIYEGFRPYLAQRKVAEGLMDLANRNSEVLKGINTPPWKITWFIVDGVSNHQVGYAIDVSLVKIKELTEQAVGDYDSIMITDYMEYQMPSEIHELSSQSAIFTTGVTSRNDIAWRTAVYNERMNEAAILLQRYNTHAGLTPLASEWWHFNDLESRDLVSEKAGDGNFVLTEVLSTIPTVQQ